MPEQAKANLNALIESTDDYIWSVDLNFTLNTFNGAVERGLAANFGIRAVEGMRPEQMFPPGIAEKWTGLYRRALSDGAFRTEYTLVNSRILDLSLNPIRVDGKVMGISVFGKDITERKAAEKRLGKAQAALKASEEQYRATFEQAAVGIVHVSFSGRILRCNPCFARLIGYPIEEIPNLFVEQITAPDDRVRNMAMLKQVIDGSGPTTWEKRYIRKDGSLTWAKVTAGAQRDAGGHPLHYISVIEDINERKAAEESLAAAQRALKGSEERYRTVFQMSPDFLTITRLSDGTYMDANRAFFERIGYTREEVIGRTSLELNIWADPRERENYIQILQAQSNCRNLEARFRNKKGEIIFGLVSSASIMADGVPCIVSITRDISEAREAAERIRDLAYFDTLTHLPNRRLLLDRLSQPHGESRHKRNRALLFVDLDDFKTLNDALGHEKGDMLLQEVARPSQRMHPD